MDPGGDPAPLLDGTPGPKVTAILVTHTDIDHIEGVADLARRPAPRSGRRPGRPSTANGHDAHRRQRRPRTCPSTWSTTATSSTSPGSSSRSPASPATLPATSRFCVDGRDLLGRPPLRGLGRPRRPPRRRLGDAARLGAAAPRPLRPGRGRLPGPRRADHARPRARDEPVPRRAPRADGREVPGAARDARRPAGRAAALADTVTGTLAERRRELYGYRRIQTPGFEDTGLFQRTVGRRARTSSRRRCTRSPTRAAAR